MKNITKNQFKKALEKGNVYVVPSKYTRNGWTEYRIYRMAHNKVIGKTDLLPVIVSDSQYHKEGNIYKCVAWGTNRVLEIILSIGEVLGLSFHEIAQNYQMLN